MGVLTMCSIIAHTHLWERSIMRKGMAVWAGSLQTFVGALNHVERNEIPLNFTILILPKM